MGGGALPLCSFDSTASPLPHPTYAFRLPNNQNITTVIQVLQSEALATILDRQTDAILLDLRAPVMERLAALRAMDGQPKPRIVILTGNLVAAPAPFESIRPNMQRGATHLTARELDIVRAVASGLRNKVIAAKFRVTEGTVKVHLHNIYKKLGLDSRLTLMVYCKEHGLA